MKKNYLKKKWIALVLFAVMVFTGAGVMSGTGGTVEAAGTIKLDKSKATIYVGNSTSLKLKGATANKVKWSSKNLSIAKVSSKGKVTALKKGSTTVTARYKNKSYTCNITVKSAKISEKKLTLRIGYGYNIEVVNTSGKVTWNSSDKKIAKVNSNGYINPLTVGKVNITAKVGSEKYICKLSVVKAFTEEDFVFDWSVEGGYTNYIDYSTKNPDWYWSWDNASIQDKSNRGINIGDTFDDFISAYGYSEYTAVPSNDKFKGHFSNSAYPRTRVVLDYFDGLTQKHYYKRFYFDKNGTLVVIIWHT